MKREVYSYPKSSFLSTEKDMNLIVQMIMKNERLKKMLHYTTRDCMNKPNLTEDETLELFGKNIPLEILCKNNYIDPHEVLVRLKVKKIYNKKSLG